MIHTIRWLQAAAIYAGVFMGSTAEAKVGDQKWAACVWEQVPASAARWLKMPLPGPMADVSSPNVLLGHRLAASCYEPTAKEKQRNASPNWKAMARSLAGSMPKTPIPASDLNVVQLALCESRATRENGVEYVFRREVVARANGLETPVFERYFILSNAQSVPLPDDLRVVPPEGTPIQRTCRTVDSQGELIDA